MATAHILIPLVLQRPTFKSVFNTKTISHPSLKFQKRLRIRRRMFQHHRTVCKCRTVEHHASKTNLKSTFCARHLLMIGIERFPETVQHQHFTREERSARAQQRRLIRSRLHDASRLQKWLLCWLVPEECLQMLCNFSNTSWRQNFFPVFHPC